MWIDIGRASFLRPPNDLSLSRKPPACGNGSAARRLPQLEIALSSGVPPRIHSCPRRRSRRDSGRRIAGSCEELGGERYE
jgi:hypothetical protein